MHEHHKNHGDGVKDIAFEVEDATALHDKAVSKGAKSVRAPYTSSDENGKVIMATIATYGDTVHTFIQRIDFKGIFLPGYKQHPLKEKINSIMPIVNLNFVDHVVGNQPEK